MRRAGLILSLLTLGVGTSVFAGPFILPLNFAPNRDFVSFQAGQGDNYFAPNSTIRPAGDFYTTSPSGEVTKLATVTNLREFSVFEAALPVEGTWRISTGDRIARQAKWAKIGVEWKQVRQPPAGSARGGQPAAPRPNNQVDEADVPADAPRMDQITRMTAEAYVTRGAPSRGALKPVGKGFELSPVTHPNEVFAGEPFRFTLLYDGKPVPALAFMVLKGGDQYADVQTRVAGRTDAAGNGSVTLKTPGVYVLEATYPVLTGNPAPGEAPAPLSVNYILTFEVTR